MNPARPAARPVVVVVDRRDVPLFDYLSRAFKGVKDVSVVLDRRLGERRRGPAAGLERRRRERRARTPAVESFGCRLVRLPAAPPPPAVDPAEPPPDVTARHTLLYPNLRLSSM